MFNASSTSDIYHAWKYFKCLSLELIQPLMSVAEPLALERHYFVVAPVPAVGQFAVSPTE